MPNFEFLIRETPPEVIDRAKRRLLEAAQEANRQVGDCQPLVVEAFRRLDTEPKRMYDVAEVYQEIAADALSRK
jgi:hypothetical protein